MAASLMAPGMVALTLPLSLPCCGLPVEGLSSPTEVDRSPPLRAEGFLTGLLDLSRSAAGGVMENNRVAASEAVPDGQAASMVSPGGSGLNSSRYPSE